MKDAIETVQAALRRVQYEAVSLADAQVIAMEALAHLQAQTAAGTGASVDALMAAVGELETRVRSAERNRPHLSIVDARNSVRALASSLAAASVQPVPCEPKG